MCEDNKKVRSICACVEKKGTTACSEGEGSSLSQMQIGCIDANDDGKYKDKLTFSLWEKIVCFSKYSLKGASRKTHVIYYVGRMDSCH